MIWRLKHRLFGWDYVHLKNTATEIVRRVRRTASGERYVVYFAHDYVFIDRPLCGWTVTELTLPIPASRTIIIVRARPGRASR